MISWHCYLASFFALLGSIYILTRRSFSQKTAMLIFSILFIPIPIVIGLGYDLAFMGRTDLSLIMVRLAGFSVQLSSVYILYSFITFPRIRYPFPVLFTSVIFTALAFYLIVIRDDYVTQIVIESGNFQRISGKLYDFFTLLVALGFLVTLIILTVKIIRRKKNPLLRYQLFFLLLSYLFQFVFSAVFTMFLPKVFHIFTYYTLGSIGAFFIFSAFIYVNLEKSILSYSISSKLIVAFVLLTALASVILHYSEYRNLYRSKMNDLSPFDYQFILQIKYPAENRDFSAIEKTIDAKMIREKILYLTIQMNETEIYSRSNPNIRNLKKNTILQSRITKSALFQINHNRYRITVFYDNQLLYAKLIENLLGFILFSIIVLFVVIVIISLIIRNSFTRQADLIAQSLNEISTGNFGTQMEVINKNEVGYIAENINRMSEKIEMLTNELLNTNLSLTRFIPIEFLTFLEKKTLIEITLGDKVQKRMNILFSDIRSYTTLSESMTPEENFNFINSYLRRLGPIIRQNSGFIDKYIGDGIMALFPNSPDHALDTAILIQKEINHYNEHRKEQNFQPIRIGIGIHTGDLMLGTIGEDERIQTTVISDDVNIASRIENLTKAYDAKILITVQTLDSLINPANYHCRFLDEIRFKGKEKTTRVYELLDSSLNDTEKIKLQTREKFSKAYELYRNRQFPAALTLFQTLHQNNPGDRASRLYMERCNKLIHETPGERWNPVIEIDIKS